MKKKKSIKELLHVPPSSQSQSLNKTFKEKWNKFKTQLLYGAHINKKPKSLAAKCHLPQFQKADIALHLKISSKSKIPPQKHPYMNRWAYINSGKKKVTKRRKKTNCTRNTISIFEPKSTNFKLGLKEFRYVNYKFPMYLKIQSWSTKHELLTKNHNFELKQRTNRSNSSSKGWRNIPRNK